MAKNILAASDHKYRLPESDRQQLLATVPPAIEYAGGIVPVIVLQRSSKYFPKLIGLHGITQSKMLGIMQTEVAGQREKFIKAYGNDGLSE